MGNNVIASLPLKCFVSDSSLCLFVFLPLLFLCLFFPPTLLMPCLICNSRFRIGSACGSQTQLCIPDPSLLSEGQADIQSGVLWLHPCAHMPQVRRRIWFYREDSLSLSLLQGCTSEAIVQRVKIPLHPVLAPQPVLLDRA